MGILGFLKLLTPHIIFDSNHQNSVPFGNINEKYGDEWHSFTSLEPPVIPFKIYNSRIAPDVARLYMKILSIY
jgi:hypothetical protein